MDFQLAGRVTSGGSMVCGLKLAGREVSGGIKLAGQGLEDLRFADGVIFGWSKAGRNPVLRAGYFAGLEMKS